MSKKPNRGGKREGAGRKPARGAAKVTTSISVTPQVKKYLESTGSGSETVESTIRRSKAFREWERNQ